MASLLSFFIVATLAHITICVTSVNANWCPKNNGMCEDNINKGCSDKQCQNECGQTSCNQFMNGMMCPRYGWNPMCCGCYPPMMNGWGPYGCCCAMNNGPKCNGNMPVMCNGCCNMSPNGGQCNMSPCNGNMCPCMPMSCMMRMMSMMPMMGMCPQSCWCNPMWYNNCGMSDSSCNNNMNSMNSGNKPCNSNQEAQQKCQNHGYQQNFNSPNNNAMFNCRNKQHMSQHMPQQMSQHMLQHMPQQMSQHMPSQQQMTFNRYPNGLSPMQCSNNVPYDPNCPQSELDGFCPYSGNMNTNMQ